MGNLNISPIVFRIVVLNVIVFLLLNLRVLNYVGLNAELIMNQFFVLHKSNLLGFRPIGNDGFLPVQIITHFFTHGSFLHILVNMFALISFGPIMENIMKPKRFFAFYLFCGIFGGLLIAFLDPSTHPVVGASGAILGVVTGFSLYFPQQKLTMFTPFPITMSARTLMIGTGVVSALFVLSDIFHFKIPILGLYLGGGSISHFGHLAGMVAALIFFYSGIGKYIPND